MLGFVPQLSLLPTIDLDRREGSYKVTVLFGHKISRCTRNAGFLAALEMTLNVDTA